MLKKFNKLPYSTEKNIKRVRLAMKVTLILVSSALIQMVTTSFHLWTLVFPVLYFILHEMDMTLTEKLEIKKDQEAFLKKLLIPDAENSRKN